MATMKSILAAVACVLALSGACASALAQVRTALPGCDFEVSMPKGSWRKTYGEWEAIKSPVEALPAIDARCSVVGTQASKDAKLIMAGILANQAVEAFALKDAVVSRIEQANWTEIRYSGRMRGNNGSDWMVLGTIAVGPRSLLAVSLTEMRSRPAPDSATDVFSTIRLVRR